jgi:hypothetical protein
MKCKDCCYYGQINHRCYMSCGLLSKVSLDTMKPDDTCEWMKDKKVCPICKKRKNSNEM